MNDIGLSRDMGICREALSYTQGLLKGGQDEPAVSLLLDVRLLAGAMAQRLEGVREPSLYQKYAALCCRNLEYALERFANLPERRPRVFECEVMESFLRTEYCLQQHEILRSPERLQAYRARILQDLGKARGSRMERMGYPLRASILLVAYNKLEYTKLAAESILEHTDFSRGDVELVTMNNGSTDGTEAYFDSLPNVKNLNFRHNVPLFNVLNPSILQGRYVVPFSNDAVATPRWLEQLLRCMESDKRIAMAVPTCNKESISNQQGIAVPYRNEVTDMGRMQAFAEKRNHSDPQLWEDRIRLMPFVSIFRRDLMAIPFLDPSYTQMAFTDDDLSTSLRRTGWRMVLAKDTFLHHFGAITLGSRGSAGAVDDPDGMRRIFLSKWGVDAWESSECGHARHSALPKWFHPKRRMRLLWIEPLFGKSFLDVRNHLCLEGCEELEADAVLLDKRYLPDAQCFFGRIFQGEDALRALKSAPGHYDGISSGAYFQEWAGSRAVELLERLYALLAPGGTLAVPIKNEGSLNSIAKLVLNGGEARYGLPAGSVPSLNIRALLKELRQHGTLGQARLHGIKVEDAAKPELLDAFRRQLQALFSPYFSDGSLDQLLDAAVLEMVFERAPHAAGN